jgi:hypothetical protein
VYHDGFRTNLEVLLCLVWFVRLLFVCLVLAVMQLVLDQLVWRCGGDAHIRL